MCICGLQCVAVWVAVGCSVYVCAVSARVYVLQCVYVAVCRLQWVAVGCMLQWVAVCCSGLQYVAVGCDMLQWIAVGCSMYAVSARAQGACS